MKAVEVLMDHGVPEDRIIFINLVYFLVLLFSFSNTFIDRVSRRTSNLLHQVPAAQSGM